MSCLIIKNDGIGDLILAYGLISEFGMHFGGHVDLVTCGANKEIAEGIEPFGHRFFVTRDDLGYYRPATRFGLSSKWPMLRLSPKLLKRISGP